MAFTTTVGAGGTSLIGTSGIDTTSFDPGTLLTSIYIGAQGDNDVVNITTSQANAAAINMGGGNDIVNVAAGLRNSTLKTDDGNDTITIAGTLQASTVSGLNGLDTISVTNVNGALVNGNAGSDAITLLGSVTNNGLVVGGSDGDTITVGSATTAATLTSGRINGQDGADTITILSLNGMSSSGGTINGGQGSDFINAAGINTTTVLSGDLGNDTVTGGGGSDTIYGGEGTDRITGGVGADNITTGTGDDTLIQNNGDSFAGAAGNLTGGNWVVGSTATFANGIDYVTDFTGGDGGDILFYAGIGARTNAAPTALLTAAGSNTMAGANGTANTVYYLSGNMNTTTNVFTVTANGAGADTLILASVGAQTIANQTTAAVLMGTNSTTLSGANF